MNRRQLIISVITAAVSTGLAVHTIARGAGSAPVFLHDLYERETARHNAREPADGATFHALFTREMRELMSAPRRADPGEPAGPILHALFGRGVLPGTNVLLSGVTTIRNDDGATMLNVTLTVRGSLRELVVVLLEQDRAWRIHEIEYGPNDTLAGYYRRITGQ